MPTTIRRVNGGIITDQMLEGKLSFYDMTLVGLFANTISDGTVILYDVPTFGGINTVGNGQPVPKSAAEIAFQVITTKATVVQINLISSAKIQFALENDSNGWDTTIGDTPNAAANIQVALRALGIITVPDNTSDGIAVDFSTVVVTAKDFVLV